LILPQISVIVPVYNVEKYLPRCVKSVLAQSFPDFELLLVNDASTDGSLAAAREFEFDRRVKVLDKPHGGLGDTRNYGVLRASGKYLLFVDSDDWIEEDMFRDLYQLAESYRSDLVVFNYVRENTGSAERRECRLPVNYPECGAGIREKMLAELIGPDAGGGVWRSVEMLGCAWRRMYLRSWYTEHGIQYGNEQKIMLEDLPASIEAHCACKRLLVVGGAYYHYRYNPNSLSTRYRPRKMEMLTACFETVKKILEDRGIYEQYAERHLAWFLRSAAHSSLVNCFSPKNPANFRGRWREVRGILQNPVLRRAAKSDYLKHGTRADRIVLRVLRLRFTLLVYPFYRVYSSALRNNGKKK
jgi:glycosyltransferase involved in cell wall biosynthesis